MKKYGAEQMTGWMEGALIRRADELSGSEIELDGTVRIVVFDRKWHIDQLHCNGSALLDERLYEGGKIFAVDQRTVQLHFAVREIADYVSNINGSRHRFGANVMMQIRAGDMYSLRPLFESMKKDRDRLSAADVYCTLQETIEDAWRRAVKERQDGSIWAQDDCMHEMKALEPLLEAETKRLFREKGVHCPSGMNIKGVSEPLWI